MHLKTDYKVFKIKKTRGYTIQIVRRYTIRNWINDPYQKRQLLC